MDQETKNEIERQWNEHSNLVNDVKQLRDVVISLQNRVKALEKEVLSITHGKSLGS